MKLSAILVGLLFAMNSFGAVKVGEKAPDFELKGHDGKMYKLSQVLKKQKKPVVLEWLNHGCPFVKKHYNSGNMQETQEMAKKEGAVWFSVISSAPGKQGHSDAKKAAMDAKEKKANPTAILLDPDGKVGKLYSAKTTPHMFVINKMGKIAYMGAIDDKPSTDTSDVKGATNYVKAAVKAVTGKGKMTVTSTKPYGCSVKYN